MSKAVIFCEASERECRVTDYSKDGTVAGYSTQCVKEGTACPCGKNTVGCPDPNDVPRPSSRPAYAAMPPLGYVTNGAFRWQHNMGDRGLTTTFGAFPRGPFPNANLVCH